MRKLPHQAVHHLHGFLDPPQFLVSPGHLIEDLIVALVERIFLEQLFVQGNRLKRPRPFQVVDGPNRLCTDLGGRGNRHFPGGAFFEIGFRFAAFRRGRGRTALYDRFRVRSGHALASRSIIRRTFGDHPVLFFDLQISQPANRLG